jgi:hypothetical protein
MFLAKWNQIQPLCQFIHPDLLKQLVDNEHRHARNTDMNEFTVMMKSDEIIMQMFAAYVRVHSMSSEEGFTNTIDNSVPLLKPRGPNPERPMEVDDYDLCWHAAMNLHIDTLEKVFTLMVLGATLKETQYWPVEGHAKAPSFGRVQIIMKTFGPYREILTSCIGGAEQLKTFKTPDAIFTELRRVNNRLANVAEDLRAEKNKMKPQKKLDDYIPDNRDRRRPPTQVMTKDGPRDVRLPATPYPSSKPQYSERVQSRATAPVFARRDRPTDQTGRYRPFNRSSVLETDHNHPDDTFNCDNPLLDSHGDFRKLPLSPIDQEDDGEEDWHVEESVGNLDVIGQSRFPFQGGQKLYEPTKGAKPDSTKPCFKFFGGTCQDGKACGWSHNLEHMSQLMDEKLDEIFNSKFFVPEKIKARLYNRSSNAPTTNRNASLTRVFSSSETDNEAFSRPENHQEPMEASESRSNASQQS